MNEVRYLSVSAINKYIAYKIDNDQNLRTFYIKGELSNVRNSRGHIYFVLKDEESEISGIIFANIALKLDFIPSDGMKVLINCSLTCYYKKGTYNIIVNFIEEDGIGKIYKSYLELKEKLGRLGLFDEEHKLKIPEFCYHIGVITAETGDAIKDVTSTIEKRFPLAKVYLYPSFVQGPEASRSIIECLNRASENPLLDVIIITRGGGSFEDLFCFNDEQLAYAVYNCKTPIVSAVGHENDYTIIDFVSDKRAPTPTGAAVVVTKDKQILIKDFENIKRKLDNSIVQIYSKFDNEYKNLQQLMKMHSPNNIINNFETELNNLNKRLSLLNLENKIADFKQKISENQIRLNNILNQIIKNNEFKLFNLIDKLILVNPLNIMKKGYTLVYKEDTLIKSSVELKENDQIDIHFYDGKIKAKIERM